MKIIYINENIKKINHMFFKPISLTFLYSLLSRVSIKKEKGFKVLKYS